MRSDLWQFLGTTQGAIILGALICAAGMTFGILVSRPLQQTGRHRPKQSDRTDESRILAMRCILALDDMVGGCHNAAIDAPEFSPADNGDFALHTDDPRLRLPKDVDWSLLKQDLREDILWMPNRLRNVLDALESLDVTSTLR